MRVTIIGMNNPLTTRPDYALWPDPVGCTGWNLWKLVNARTGCTRQEYIDLFMRVNLLQSRRWDNRLALQGWRDMESWVLERSDILVLLGVSVRRIVLGPEVSQEVGLIGNCALLPHPSGLNRWYNEPRNKAIAEILMEELWARATLRY